MRGGQSPFLRPTPPPPHGPRLSLTLRDLPRHLQVPSTSEQLAEKVDMLERQLAEARERERQERERRQWAETEVTTAQEVRLRDWALGRAEQERTGQGRSQQHYTGGEAEGRAGLDSTGQDRTGQDRTARNRR